ncbi:MAG: hypothetical protein IPL03_09370 [Sterolibacteriaceae bacterium]|nr:hypothetical protein [Candidatus Methylophosphatis haderslevensis]
MRSAAAPVLAVLAWLFVAAIALAASGAVPHAAAPEFGKWGVQTGHIAPTIAAGDDFYRYVNKGWLATATIPVGFPAGNAFVDLELRTEKQLQAIIDEAKAQPGAPGTPRQQIADMHASYVDTARRNALGSGMLQAELAEILKVQERREIARRMGAIGYQSLVNGGVIRDPGDPSRYVLALEQGGLGLPGRDYYLKQGKPYAGYRRAYGEYIEGVFKRAGVAGARRKAAAILAFETAIAARHWPPEKARDAVRTYKPMSTAALARYAPGFDWPAFLAEAGFGDVRRINAATDTSMRALAALFAATPLETLRAYSAFHFLDYRSPLLSDEWADAHFDMFEHQLSGVDEQPPLEVRAVRFLNSALGEPLGRLYVERHFPPESKAEIDRLVKFLRLAFRERLTRTRLDGRADPRAGAGQARRHRHQDRLPGAVARLERGAHRPRRSGRQPAPPGAVVQAGCARQTRRAGAQVGMGPEPAGDQRLFRRDRRRGGVSGRHPSAAVLRSEGRCGGEFRCHRHGDRP